MTMEFTMGTGGLPVGSYPAVYAACEPYTENRDKYGDGVLHKWRVTAGELVNQEGTRITGSKLTPKSALAKLATALAGRAIQPREKFNFSDYIGTKGQIVVAETESGGTRVEMFLRETTTQPQAPPQQWHVAPQQPQTPPPQQPEGETF